jgi:hypothetical protein
MKLTIKQSSYNLWAKWATVLAMSIHILANGKSIVAALKYCRINVAGCCLLLIFSARATCGVVERIQPSFVLGPEFVVGNQSNVRLRSLRIRLEEGDELLFGEEYWTVSYARVEFDYVIESSRTSDIAEVRIWSDDALIRVDGKEVQLETGKSEKDSSEIVGKFSVLEKWRNSFSKKSLAWRPLSIPNQRTCEFRLPAMQTSVFCEIRLPLQVYAYDAYLDNPQDIHFCVMPCARSDLAKSTEIFLELHSHLDLDRASIEKWSTLNRNSTSTHLKLREIPNKAEELIEIQGLYARPLPIAMQPVVKTSSPLSHEYRNSVRKLIGLVIIAIIILLVVLTVIVRRHYRSGRRFRNEADALATLPNSLQSE